MYETAKGLRVRKGMVSVTLGACWIWQVFITADLHCLNPSVFITTYLIFYDPGSLEWLLTR